MSRILVLLIVALNSTLSIASQSIELYVAPDGSDANPGTLQQPFATPYHAARAVQQLITKGLKNNITVFFRQGAYPLDRTWCFTPNDSGTDTFSITYTAYQNENVILTGGRQITGWQLADNDKNLWKTQIPPFLAQTSDFRQLFANDQRLTRARFPNTGQFLTVNTVSDDYQTFQLDRMIDVNDPAAQKTELVMLQIWSSSRALLNSCTATAITTATPVGWIGHKSTSAAPGRKCFLENAREFLDEPGEWFFDSQNGDLYIIVNPGKNPNDMTIIAPQIEQLIRIEGSKDHPIKNLHFENFEFAHAAWNLPPFGYSGIQACHYGAKYDAEITWSVNAAIHLEYAQHCSFDSGRIAHTGASGIAIARGGHSNRVIGNEFVDVGGNAVVVGWHEKEDRHRGLWLKHLKYDWTDPRDAPCGNDIAHNFIHHCAIVQFGGVALQTLFSNDTLIRHNLICYQPYTGISLGFIWADTPTAQKGNIVSNNYIHHVMQLLDDGGGIYTLGYQPGTRVENNLIHDIVKGHGLYTDEGSSNMLFQKNVVYRAGEFAYQHHYGHDNIIRNNIFASAGKYYVRRARGDKDIKKGISFTIDHNIFWIDNEKDLFMNRKRKEGINDCFMMDYNLLWPGEGKVLSIDGNSLDQWRQRGHDIHSVIADPLFENPSADDYRLKPDSPASQIHFHPIDMTTAGPQAPYKQNFEPLITDYIRSPMLKKE